MVQDTDMLATLVRAMFRGAKSFFSTGVRRLDTVVDGVRLTAIEAPMGTNNRFSQLREQGHEVGFIRQDGQLTHAVDISDGKVFPLSNSRAPTVDFDEVRKMAGRDGRRYEIQDALSNSDRNAA